MTASRLTEEQLVALEREIVAGLPRRSTALALLADLRAARAERDALRARLERARDALRRWDAPPPECKGFGAEFKRWDLDEQKALDDLHAALEEP